MKIHASGEDYLEAVLMVQKEKGMVRSVDLARHMGYSKPSISHAVGVLRNGGFLMMDKDGFLHLTDVGQEVAEKIYERHQFLLNGCLMQELTRKLRNRMLVAWSIQLVKNLLSRFVRPIRNRRINSTRFYVTTPMAARTKATSCPCRCFSD